MSTTSTAEPAGAVAPPEPYGRMRLVAGLVARGWLWFLVGCLVVTLVPIVFGWRPYVIESGSMEPRIHVGDVVLASPVLDSTDLVGHVVVFDRPNHPGEVLTHRVVRTDHGMLVTKGDANPTPDSAHVPMSSVRGLGRLLVKWVGLPLVWVRTGQWLWLLLFLSSLWLAGFALVRDHEPDDEVAAGGGDDADEEDGAGDGDTGPEDGPGPRGGPHGGGQRPSWAIRAVPVVLGSVLLGLPSSMAAFAATTANTNDSWSVPNYVYSTEVVGLAPYLYWRFEENGQVVQTAADSSGNGRTGSFQPNGNPANFDWFAADGALVTDVPDNAIGMAKAGACVNTTSTTAVAAPTSMTEVVWFRSPAGYSAGGKLIGFENPRLGVLSIAAGGAYDRMVYMDGNGRVWFGVNNGLFTAISSGAGLNDGTWHMAAATFGAAGMHLYVDGVGVASNANVVALPYTGFWRVGCGNLAGWGASWTGPNAPPGVATATNKTFLGGVDEAAVWTSQLTASQIAFLYWIR